MNNIFDWNHISDKLSEDEKTELKSYYKVYHRKSWAFKRALKRYKLLRYLGNTVSLLTASGGIATAIATGGISLVAISTVALLVKGYMEHQNLDIKIQTCTYAYQSYGHLLIIIKNIMRSGAFDRESLINTMANIDNFVTDNTPVVDKFFKKYDAKYLTPD